LVLASGLALRGQQIDPAQTLPDASLPQLAEMLETALAQSPQMLARQIELTKAEAAGISSRAQLYPSVNGGGRYAFESVSTSNSANSSGQGFFYNLGASYPLYRWGEVKADVEIGDLGLKISQRQYAEAYRDLAGALRAQFLRLVLFKKSLSLRERGFVLAESTYATETQRVKNGELPPTAQFPLQVAFEEAQIALERERFDYAAAKRAFIRLAGLKDLSESLIPDDMPKPVLSQDQAARLIAYFDQTDGVRDLPTAQNYRDQVRQSELRSRIAAVRLRPKFDLSASTSLENQTYLSSQSVSQSATYRHVIGVVANWSIFDGYSTRAAKLEAMAGKRQAEQQLQNFLAGLDEQKRSAVVQFNFSVRALDLAERKYSSAQGYIGYIELEFKAGRSPQTAVDQAKTLLLNSHTAAMAARAEVFGRWSDLLSMIWMDPALKKVPAQYLSHGK
jgi:outer membrane protein TolC